jgi:cyclopropane-fatty-acyl-phospholipid synthase
MGKQLGASALAPLLRELVGDALPLRVVLWDGSEIGPPDCVATLHLKRPEALRRLLYAPNEVGAARAYVSGDVDIEGDLPTALTLLHQVHPDEISIKPWVWAQTLAAALRLGVLGRPLPPPPEEASLSGGRHSLRRDARAISHHYDVSNEFYELVLGPSMTYSCARFATPSDSLEQAQAAKHDLVCRKLGLQPGRRLLDVGCGWGGMVMHAAANYDVEAVGITLSRAQYDLARKRVAEAGLGNRVEIRLQDYRDLGTEQFNAVSSVGMFEHVGHARRQAYFDTLAGVLEPQGRLLNHAISTPDGVVLDRRSFIARYVFPDGELHDVGATIDAMQKSGLEARDVETLREHYPLTLQHWVDNLMAHWDEAVELAGEGRARVWRLYMTSSILAFNTNEISVHQVLGVKTPASGDSAMPLTRAGMV